MVLAHGHHSIARRPKRQRAGALQDASRYSNVTVKAPASRSAVALHRFSPERGWGNAQPQHVQTHGVKVIPTPHRDSRAATGLGDTVALRRDPPPRASNRALITSSPIPPLRDAFCLREISARSLQTATIAHGHQSRSPRR